MVNFSDILDAAGSLSADEQETLLHILARRLADRRRSEMLGEIQEARAEFHAGHARSATADAIMDEACGET